MNTETGLVHRRHGVGPIRWGGVVLFLLSRLIPGLCSASGAVQRAFVGTYTDKGSEGIYSYGFDPATGECTSPELAGRTENPSFIALDDRGRFLYAVNEVEAFDGEPTGAVSVFAIDPDTGRLALLQQVSSLGAGPAHVALDKTGRFLMVANYNSGNVAVFPIGHDGRLGETTSFVQDAGSSVNPDRQAGPHAHFIQVSNDNRFVLVADLGIDKILVYRFDAETGSLTPNDPAFIALDPGAGPRHFAFSPSGSFLFVVTELASTVVVFEFDANRATTHRRQTVSTLPDSFTGTNTAAEIAVDASGRTLYVSNRGDDSIAQFAIEPGSGRLTPVRWVPSGGKTPRHFEMDPTGQWLFAAHQDSGGIALFRIAQENGWLIPAPASLKILNPVCVRIFAPIDERPNAQ